VDDTLSIVVEFTRAVGDTCLFCTAAIALTVSVVPVPPSKGWFLPLQLPQKALTGLVMSALTVFHEKWAPASGGITYRTSDRIDRAFEPLIQLSQIK
jgi:hypothetical protein